MTRGIKSTDRRRFYGFVDARVAAPGDGEPRLRETLLLDCIDAEAFDRDGGANLDSKNLALVKVLSTRRRLQEDYFLPPVNEGDWLQLVVAKDPGSPRAWVMREDAGYTSEGVENIRSIERLSGPDATAEGSALAAKLKAAYLLGDDAKTADPLELEGFWAAFNGGRIVVRAVDVGQASCNVVLCNGDPIGYFDVGAPLYCNQKSFHGRLCHRLPTQGFVILSHWDFDHFDLGRRKSELRQLTWFAPDQPVGPNAHKFRLSLGTNLRVLRGSISFSDLELRPGLATSATDRNGSGYSLRLALDHEVVVLTGDCSYDLIDPAVLSGATAITIPHHGGQSSAPPPPTAGCQIAVASYGKPNCYKHPDEIYLDQHAVAGWRVRRTASHPTNSNWRGSRRLIP